MTAPTYVLNVEPLTTVETPEEVQRRLDALDRWMENVVVPGDPVELSTGSAWIDYADLALKALLVVAAFLIAARI